jgi:hypothetical protein
VANPVGYLGTAEATDNGSDYNANTFLVWSILARVRTMQPCRVLSVTNAGGISPVGFVSLQPLVNQQDGYNNAVPHGPLYNVPYFRLQGGANAIIIDPQVGDIGWAGFADRDISSVKANKAQANPGSKRMFSMADAVYFGGILNGAPSQYIAFSASGVAITSPTAVTITAPNITADASENFTVNSPTITLNGNLQQGNGETTYPATLQGPITVINDVVVGPNSISVSNHTHTSESPGIQTSAPTPGT